MTRLTTSPRGRARGRRVDCFIWSSLADTDKRYFFIHVLTRARATLWPPHVQPRIRDPRRRRAAGPAPGHPGLSRRAPDGRTALPAAVPAPRLRPRAHAPGPAVRARLQPSELAGPVHSAAGVPVGAAPPLPGESREPGQEPLALVGDPAGRWLRAGGHPSPRRQAPLRAGSPVPGPGRGGGHLPRGRLRAERG